MPEVGLTLVVEGDKALMDTFSELSKHSRRKIVKPVIQGNSHRVKDRIVRALEILRSETKRSGRNNLTKLIDWFLSQPTIASTSKPRDIVRYGPEMPPRAYLGIKEKDRNYWPYALEYGHGNVPARSYLRKPIDDNLERDQQAMLEQIRVGVELAFARGVKRGTSTLPGRRQGVGNPLDALP